MGKGGNFGVAEFANEAQNLTGGVAEELTEDDMKLAEPLIPVFGMEIVKKIFATDWHLREQALNQISEEISKGTSS